MNKNFKRCTDLFWKKYDQYIGEYHSFINSEQFISFTLSTNVSCITARCYVVERRPKDQVSQSVALSLRTSIEAEIFNGQLIPLFFGSSINIVAAQASLHHDFDYRDT